MNNREKDQNDIKILSEVLSQKKKEWINKYWMYENDFDVNEIK